MTPSTFAVLGTAIALLLVSRRALEARFQAKIGKKENDQTVLKYEEPDAGEGEGAQGPEEEIEDDPTE